MNNDTSMMKKVDAGQSETIAGIIAGKLTAYWNTKIDFDLHAVIEGVDGSKELIFSYGANPNRGKLSEYPFLQHSGDEGVGGNVAAGGNSETIAISQFDSKIKAVHAFLVDYDQTVANGSAGRFSQATELKLTFEPNTGESIECLSAVKNENANALHLISLVRDAAGQMKIVNTAAGFVLPGVNQDAMKNLAFWDSPGMRAAVA